MALETAVVTLAAPQNSPYTDDFIISNSGSWDQAIIFATEGDIGGFNNAGEAGIFSIGFFDGSNQYCSQIANQRGVAASANQAKNSIWQDYCLNMKYNGSGDRRFGSIEAITDGFRITYSGDSLDEQCSVSVILIRGAVGAVCGFVNPATGSPFTITENVSGITPNFLIGISNRPTSLDTTLSIATMGIGFAAQEGSIVTNRGVAWRASESDPSDVKPHTSSTYIGGYANGAGDLRPEIYISAFNSGSFDITNNGTLTDSSSVMYFAFELNEQVHLFHETVPTSAGDWTPGSPSFIPGSIFLAGSMADNINTNIGGSLPESLAIYFADDAGYEAGMTLIVEDGISGASTIQTDAQLDTEFNLSSMSGGTDSEDFKADNPTFDSAGVTFPSASINPSGGTRYIIGAIIEQAAAGGTPASGAMMKMMQEGHLRYG